MNRITYRVATPAKLDSAALAQWTKDLHNQREAKEYDPTSVYLPRKIGCGDLEIPLNLLLWKNGDIIWDLHAASCTRPIGKWTLTKGDPSSSMPGILKHFQSLAKSTDSAIVEFVATWGVLGIDAKCDVDPEHAMLKATKRSTGQTWPRRQETLPNIKAVLDTPWPNLVFTENVETYRYWSRRVTALINIASRLQDSEPGDINDWAIWLKHERTDRHIAKVKITIQDGETEAEEFLENREGSGQRGITLRSMAVYDDAEHWKNYKQNYFGNIEQEHILLSQIVNKWVQVEIAYTSSVENQGRIFPVARIKLAPETSELFTAHMILERRSVLPVIGLAVLYSLQGKIPLCGYSQCANGVSEPSSTVRNGYNQYCSDECQRLGWNEYQNKYKKEKRRQLKIERT